MKKNTTKMSFTYTLCFVISAFLNYIMGKIKNILEKLEGERKKMSCRPWRRGGGGGDIQLLPPPPNNSVLPVISIRRVDMIGECTVVLPLPALVCVLLLSHDNTIPTQSPWVSVYNIYDNDILKNVTCIRDAGMDQVYLPC